MKINFLYCFFFFCMVCLSCQPNYPEQKYNGLSLVASRDSLKTAHILPLKNVNANTVALMPFAFLQDLKNPELHFNDDRQWWGERVEGLQQNIRVLQENEIKIMLKPQIWIWHGEFTGDLNMSSEENWIKFENRYLEYILLYAELAEKEQIELFCIGTELYNFTEKRPEFWQKMIAEVRKVYSGKITYAENWDKVDQFELWDQLDFIGVDAYFPVSEEENPTKAELIDGWKSHKKMLQKLSSEYKKQVIFTEYGYRNVDFAAKEPWKASTVRRNDEVPKNLNEELQAKALQVIYDEFWTENWFAGGFLWKWHHDHDRAGGKQNDRFTPQNKLAENIVKMNYKKFKLKN
ncbi:glycoside hydrolase family 113 [Zunongwangia sp. HRR-M8]|uniref:glycoside hydrolase family 113 n=1 Tax=Zunongwangia sp. HRR-M8 TaxID=3015170 RepID=UPI0022DD1D4A|nr:glycoside hydrolase [Zunongwangia sp. HRR-M8]WBL22846.1 glycoside hydrolase [Zunongwangia sp. HRR-M8]